MQSCGAICTLTLLLFLICYKSFDNRRGNHAENIVIFLEDKKIRIYQKYNFENRILKSIDDTYLFYVNCEKNVWGTKINKIFCVEIESGKSWCIYKTYHPISDIIIEN